MERKIPEKNDILSYLKDDRNWGRWGDDDQIGAVNMVTPAKRVAAAQLIKTGEAVSLSREFPNTQPPITLPLLITLRGGTSEAPQQDPL